MAEVGPGARARRCPDDRPGSPGDLREPFQRTAASPQIRTRPMQHDDRRTAASRGEVHHVQVAPATSTILPLLGNARCISSTPACVTSASPASAATTITVTIENVRKLLHPDYGRIPAGFAGRSFHSAEFLWIAGSYRDIGFNIAGSNFARHARLIERVRVPDLSTECTGTNPADLFREYSERQCFRSKEAAIDQMVRCNGDSAVRWKAPLMVRASGANCAVLRGGRTRRIGHNGESADFLVEHLFFVRNGTGYDAAP